ncbi:M20 family metallopeptidase [Athalassotoga saccharophila]|uniref:M20 family metallopeptidase n=1 Tax=Athalassotoga saccharophila TaxID=1441386 RepID=UPI00137A35C2|nr:M20 family metallopeptidase [Athalassotoga saccharophila]BBJ28620.1 N-acetyldiaminopimelate deacetylase [Athalassotoga saccharophila]
MDSIELRRLIHQNPELSFQEYKTQELLKKAVEEIGVEVYPIAQTGLIAIIKRVNSPYILLRADMDALPIKEKTGWKFSSQNDYMHACGHDVHMAIMYEVMKAIYKWNGNFIFVFQPAEESGGGASRVIEEIRDKYEISCAIATHVTDEYPFGTVATNRGVIFASATEINLTFTGRPAHIAFYKDGIDAIRAASNFLEKFYSVDFGENAIAGFGKAFGGQARNIVADEFQLQGTIRTDTVEKSRMVYEKIYEIAKDICKTTGSNFSLEKGSFYVPVNVDERMFEIFKKTVDKSEFELEMCKMKYTGEDFGFFSQEYPSLIFWAGTMEKTRYGLHNPMFLPDDKVIKPIANLIVSYVREIMENAH